VTGVAGRSFVAQLSPTTTDPWALTPFFGALERVHERASHALGGIAEVRLGFQAYGSAATFDLADRNGPRVLEDPRGFTRFEEIESLPLRRLVSEPSTLRRTGPVDLYPQEKIVVRTTTNRHQIARLAALVDTSGLWFNDKFVGIRPNADAVPARGLAAYFQTAVCELWLATNNPSRKLRVGTLARLPLPALPTDWWRRAAGLVQPGRTTSSPRWGRREATLLDDGSVDHDDWRWFEHVVAVAFGLSTSELSAIEDYLDEYLTVGRRD
jgi:hypothetical protein